MRKDTKFSIHTNLAINNYTPKFTIKNNIVEPDKSTNPTDLLELIYTNGSPIIQGIINKKVSLINSGFAESISDDLNEFIKLNHLNELLSRIAIDYSIFNAFAFKVVKNNIGELVDIQFVNVSNLKVIVDSNGDEVGFAFSRDWENSRKSINKPVIYPKYSNQRGESILYYREYNPINRYYAIPDYIQSINWIQMDYQISQFHLSNLENGFFPSFRVEIPDTFASQEERDVLYDSLISQFTSPSQSGKLILTEKINGESIVMQPINLDQNDKKFESLLNSIRNKIIEASSIPPALLTTIPGQLGSSTDRADLLIEFDESYIQPRKNAIENVLNSVLYPEFKVNAEINKLNRTNLQ